jgi:hypothetical protein
MNGDAILRLGDFSAGMRNRAASPLNSIPNALTAGENITLENRILETRPGYEVYSSGSLPNSIVKYLEQVRFPTNETSFLVAQVQVDQRQGGVERSNHCVNYYDGKLYIWGGSSTTMDIYNCATGVWSTGTSGGTARYGSTGTVYNGKIYYWGGYSGGALNSVDIYDPTDGEGGSWSTGSAGGTARWWHCAEYYDGKIYFFNGFTTTVDIYDPTLDSWDTGASGGPADTNSMASCIVGDVVYLWAGQGEGYWNTMYSYTIGTDTWATLASGGTARAGHTMEHYDGVIYMWGGWSGSGDPLNTMDAYTISTNTYTTGVDGGNARKYHNGAYDGSRYWYQHGGVDAEDENINLLDIFDFLNMAWITGSYGELYAALDDGSPAFEKIYDLGTAPGVVSCAVLNDVAVITEGVEKRPLWWAGCLSDDGSDWTNPLAVLISQDGDNWFDISSEVLDKDSERYAILTGGVSARGALLVRSMVPYVKGFAVWLQTYNTDIGVDSASDVTAVFDSSGDVNRKDLKEDILYWKQDSGATGHFEGETLNPDVAAAVDKGGGLVGIPCTGQPYSTGNIIEIRNSTYYTGTFTVDATSGTDEIVITATYNAETFTGAETINQRITLGAGNDAPDIEEGLTIYYSGGDLSIFSITDDGEANGEVELIGELADQTVTSIYGLVIDSQGLRPEPSTGSVLDTVDYAHTTGRTVTVGQMSYRIVVDSSFLTATAEQVRITLYSGDTSTNPGMQVNNVSIVERSGSTENGVTTPTEINFSSASLNTLKQGDQSATSAWTDFSIDQSKSYLVIIDLASTATYNDITRSNRVAINAEYDTNKKNYYKADASSYDQQTVSGFLNSSWARPALMLEVRDAPVIPTTAFESTTDSISINIGAYDSFLGLTIDADEPSGSYIYYALSFTGGTEWQVYLDSAWQTIVQLDGATWQYWDGGSFQNATENTELGALHQAFADSDNQMVEADVEALTVDELVGTDSFVPGVTTTLGIAVSMISGGTSETIPVLSSIAALVEDAGSTKVKVWRDGAWQDESWTDTTQDGDVPFAQDGLITTSADYSEADYHVINGEAGYWYMLSFVNGLTPGTAITRIQMSAPCQLTANIGLGWEEMPLGFLFMDYSESSLKDFTAEVSDYTETNDSAAYFCNNIAAETPETPTTDDYALVGNPGKFSQIKLTVHKLYNNQQTATMLAYYWNGAEYSELTIEDSTESDNATLSHTGTISFSVPDDWVQHMPFGEYPRGYWIKISWDAAIDVVGITECRLQPVPDNLAKHKFAAAWRNRVVMAARPEASDQVDISRELEEYGWTGGDIHSQRIGGQDNIVALFSAFDRCFVVKPNDWFMLTESSTGFSFARLASISEAPVNNRCIVHAPAGPMGQGASPGLFFLGLNGAYLVTGIQSDLEWGTGQIQKISDGVNWWQSSPTVRLDLDYLYLSTGMYSSTHHCIFWSVPMITDGSTPQTTPNYLLVYDIGLGCWYPPWDLAFTALCSGFETNANAPGKLGRPVLYAGDSQGRVLKLFEATTDNSAEIDAWAETGLLTPNIEWQWQLQSVFAVAKTDSADNQLNMSVYLNGATSGPKPILFEKAGDDTYSTYEAINDFAGAQDGALARFFKYRFDMSGPSKIFGVDIKHWADIEDPDTE